MIVKILSASRTFNAVRYNTDKIDRNHGELMKIRNFGIIGNGFDLKPQEVKNYLAAFSLSNPRITKPQFHATISCKGRETSKEELTDLAEKWLIKMGYGENPYLIVFHSDTPNNHVHLVSTRVGLDGKKINDHFEKRRAQEHLKELLGQNKQQIDASELTQLEAYQFKTLAQFRLVLERAGYHPRIRDEQLQVYRKGELLKSYPLEELKQQMAQTNYNEARLLKLQAILHKYQRSTDLTLVPEYRVLAGERQGELTGYHSALSRMMHQKFGVEFVFHFKDDKPPYGYTIIDHVGQQVYKGSELMKLAQLSGLSPLSSKRSGSSFRSESRRAGDWRVSSESAAKMLAVYLDVPSIAVSGKIQRLNEKEQADYRQLLHFLAHQKGPTALREQGLFILRDDKTSFLVDSRRQLICELEEILSREETADLSRQQEQVFELPQPHHPGLAITADQDDELVYGRRRRGKTARRKG